MKHRRMRWSERGANALLMLMCCIKNGTLRDALRNGIRQTGQEPETPPPSAVLSAAKVREGTEVGEDIYADLYKRTVPLLGAALSNNASGALRGIINNIRL